jgi:hypothetical protein
MNTNEIKIEKGIPLPPRLVCRQRGGKWVDLLRRMEIGDSIVLTIPEYSSFHINSRRLGWKVRSQKQPDGIHNRVWLVGKATP